MPSAHRVIHHRHHTLRSSRTDHCVPFFEFMLYGADAFAGAVTGARLVPVARGRSLTLVPAPRTDAPHGRMRRGA